MASAEELLEIEKELAGGGGDEYRAHLADDAVVIVPGQSLDKAGTVGAMETSPGWDEFSIDEPQLRHLGDEGAVLTYRFTGRRGENQRYAALMSSAYSRSGGAWKLVLHQQTPLDVA